MTDPARAASIARKFTVVANEAEIMLESVLVAAFEEVRKEERAKSHEMRIALERIVSTLGPKVLMCGCMASCKNCRAGLYHEAVDALTIARDAIAAIRARSDATAGGG